jgi:HJR/Mrr/RecB family endonuclease
MCSRHAGLLARAARDPSALERLDPAQFERLVAQLLESRGYAVRSAPRSADQGFDLILEGDPHTLVEVKRYRHDNLVSVSTLRQLLGVLAASGGERAIVVSSSASWRGMGCMVCPPLGFS